jgi:hypothetical protein
MGGKNHLLPAFRPGPARPAGERLMCAKGHRPDPSNCAVQAAPRFEDRRAPVPTRGVGAQEDENLQLAWSLRPPLPHYPLLDRISPFCDLPRDEPDAGPCRGRERRDVRRHLPGDHRVTTPAPTLAPRTSRGLVPTSLAYPSHPNQRGELVMAQQVVAALVG